MDFTLFVLKIIKNNRGNMGEKKENGGEGHRSPYLSHAKRALYHLSYTPSKLSFQIVHINILYSLDLQKMEIEKQNPLSQATLVSSYVFVVIKVYAERFGFDCRVGLRIVDISSEKQIYGLIVSIVCVNSQARIVPCWVPLVIWDRRVYYSM